MTSEEIAAEPRHYANEHSIQDASYHPGLKVKFFTHPRQRQKWGDTQILPRTNWGDIFFDLFYVAAAYNVANILVDSPTNQGFLYFIGTLFPIISLWQTKTYYDSRYAVGDDLWHRIYEVGVLLALATVVLHVRPVDIMSNAQENVEMFAFSLALSIASMLAFLRYVETFFWAMGEKQVIWKSSLRDVRFALPAFCLFVAATIYAGIEFYRHGTETTNEAVASDGGYRNLADPTEESTYAAYSTSHTTDVPIYLCFFGAVAQALVMGASVILFFPSGGRHKEIVIPMNIDFVIHRNGEWIMLMLGETVLSLLIVDTSDSKDYYLTFYAGLLTIVLTQLLHFRSQPHHADDHATRRDKNAGVLWNITNSIYSAALICLGAAFKMFLYEFTYEERRLLLKEEMDFETTPRWLAGGGGGSEFSADDRKQRSANIYCAAMAVIWFCMDLMLFLHSGFARLNGRCRSAKTKTYSHKGVVLVFLRVALLGFIATLSQWETDPEKVSVIGLGAVCAQLLLRTLGNFLFRDEFEDEDEDEQPPEERDPEEMKWPNTTHAAAIESKELDGTEEN